MRKRIIEQDRKERQRRSISIGQTELGETLTASLRTSLPNFNSCNRFMVGSRIYCFSNATVRVRKPSYLSVCARRGRRRDYSPSPVRRGFAGMAASGQIEGCDKMICDRIVCDGNGVEHSGWWDGMGRGHCAESHNWEEQWP